MTYGEVLQILEAHPDAVSCFIAVRDEDGDLGLFWGTFALIWRGQDLTQRVAADTHPDVRRFACLVAAARTQREALDRGLKPLVV